MTRLDYVTPLLGLCLVCLSMFQPVKASAQNPVDILHYGPDAYILGKLHANVSPSTVDDTAGNFAQDDLEWILDFLANQSGSGSDSTQEEIYSHTYLIGNGTQSVIDIPNPFRHRRILVNLREKDPPYEKVISDISLPDTDTIRFSFLSPPSVNQYIANVVLSSTSFLIGGAQTVSVNHGLGSNHIVRQIWKNSGGYHLAAMDNSADANTFSATSSTTMATDALRVNLLETYSFWDFPASQTSEIEHQLNSRELAVTAIRKSDNAEVSMPLFFRGADWLEGEFLIAPSAGEYELFSFPIIAKFPEFSGTVSAASNLIIVEGQIIGVN